MEGEKGLLLGTLVLSAWANNVVTVIMGTLLLPLNFLMALVQPDS